VGKEKAMAIKLYGHLKQDAHEQIGDLLSSLSWYQQDRLKRGFLDSFPNEEGNRVRKVVSLYYDGDSSVCGEDRRFYADDLVAAKEALQIDEKHEWWDDPDKVAQLKAELGLD
jgi:hypothetical protein